MLPLSKTSTFYKLIQQNNLASKADQWGSLASCDQYRLSYAKTAQWVPPGSHCLDWGCGNGHFSYFLTRNGLRTDAYSFENAPEFLANEPLFKHTRANPRDPISLPYGKETFDAVFSVGVLEHVHESSGDARKSVRELERVLKKNGHFLIFHLPNRYSWIEFIVRRLNRMNGNGATRHEHTALFTRKGFLELLQGTSLEVLEGGRYNFIPRNSLGRLPSVLTNQPGVCNVIDAFDSALAAVCPVLCQNWYFILWKKV